MPPLSGGSFGRNNMDSLLESNERTLIIFEAVQSGLASCLTLVHADIKQMTEHRNQLAQLEQQQIQAKLVSPESLLAKASEAKGPSESEANVCQSNNGLSVGCGGGGGCEGHAETDEHTRHRQLRDSLSMLDKRLADSFSQALSLNDLRKSSLAKARQASDKQKQQQQQQQPTNSSAKSSLFQVLLGKATNRKQPPPPSHVPNSHNHKQLAPDNRAIIDDINRQTRLALQYSKQLEAHLFKVEELKARYEMHLKMGLVVKSVARSYLAEGANLGGALGSRHSSASSSGSSYSLARARHCRSMLISGGGGGADSSGSSINLSAAAATSTGSGPAERQKWRRSAALPPADHQKGHPMACQGQCQPSAALQLGQQASLPLGQRSSSTLSLGGHGSAAASRGLARRLNLAKQLISPAHHHCQAGSPASQDGNEFPAQHFGPPNQSLMARQDSAYLRRATLEEEPLGATSGQPVQSDLCTGDCWFGPASAALSKSSGNLATNHRSFLKVGAGLFAGQSHQQTDTKRRQSKTTIKEFIENIDKIESELESYMGSFLLAVEDIQGFARVCQGDVFEVSIKYGDNQKFKTKISVLKGNQQRCDHRRALFKAKIADVLAIKAHECKGLGKRVLLGHKLCETKDLFAARSQLMTISLNQTGSIKLNLIVTWNPLHFSPNQGSQLGPLAGSHDLSHISLPPTPLSSSTLSSGSAGSSLNGTLLTDGLAKTGASPSLCRARKEAIGPPSDGCLYSTPITTATPSVTTIQIESQCSASRLKQAAAPKVKPATPGATPTRHSHNNSLSSSTSSTNNNNNNNNHYGDPYQRRRPTKKLFGSPGEPAPASNFRRPSAADSHPYGYYIPPPDYLDA